MSEVVIYHNPKCSKSRQTLALLQENNIEPTIIEYLKDVPTITEIKTILKKLGVPPRELMRKKEEAYKANHLNDESLTDEQLIIAMHQHPKIIERPIVVKGDKAAIGRPPESVLELL